MIARPAVVGWGLLAGAAAALPLRQLRGVVTRTAAARSWATGSVEKLERYLSKAGVLSRTLARRHVKKGEVLVNGVRIVDPWHAVHPDRDTVEVVGRGIVEAPADRRTPASIVLYHKPAGVVVTLREDRTTRGAGRCGLAAALPPPWCDQLAPHVPALRPVGRLDADSTGLLLLTDDSGLAARLTDPGTCEKEYLLGVQPIPNHEKLERLRMGVKIRDGNTARGATRPCRVEILKRDEARQRALLRFGIEEGRNRQLRRMCATVGLDVESLLRVRVGPVALGSLPEGEARAVTQAERASLLELARGPAAAGPRSPPPRMRAPKPPGRA